ncbi:hypothetical protein SAMN04488168_10346 [Bacillus sp. 491mf]|uniref:hypothetical protein n=1 Tax=Bacillus TaxID=1386 RepID=UPI0008EA3A6C|nr:MULTISPECIES: hypothetical protein [unclassified Bacillus (in: firmicutes)]SFC25937.1 hypothetical protein SAMN04488168_10346 [Bacillus sp. 491mf]
MTIITIIFIAFALIVLTYTNLMTHSLCQQKQLSDRRQTSVFRFINVCITILLISSYIEIIFHAK